MANSSRNITNRSGGADLIGHRQFTATRTIDTADANTNPIDVTATLLAANTYKDNGVVYAGTTGLVNTASSYQVLAQAVPTPTEVFAINPTTFINQGSGDVDLTYTLQGTDFGAATVSVVISYDDPDIASRTVTLNPDLTTILSTTNTNGNRIYTRFTLSSSVDTTGTHTVTFTPTVTGGHFVPGNSAIALTPDPIDADVTAAGTGVRGMQASLVVHSLMKHQQQLK